MRFELTVTVEVTRSEGRFASREEIVAQIIEAIEGADPGEVNGDAGGVYTVDAFEVAEVERPTTRVKS